MAEQVRRKPCRVILWSSTAASGRKIMCKWMSARGSWRSRKWRS